MGNKNGKDADGSGPDDQKAGGQADSPSKPASKGPPPAPSSGAAKSGQFMSVIDEDGTQYSVRSDAPLSKIPSGEEDDTFASQYKRTAPLSVDDFDLLKVIGKGSFGKVMQVRKKDSGKIYAMKVLKKDQLIARKQVAHTKTERKVLEDIDSPFISQLKFAFQTANKLYIVMDYYNGGELFFHLKEAHRFDEDRARFYAAQIVMALETLHSHGIVYRDLKPENVLLEASGYLRLSDFGLAKEGITKDNLTSTFCGTPEYLAPEVLQGQGHGFPCDWWSLGTLLYEMLTGLPPFYNQNLHVMYEKIVRAKVQYPSYLSAEARSLIQALLERNPKLRLGYEQDGAEIRAHPFFAPVDWDKLQKKEVQPPFVPTVTEGKLDTGNVDEEFKREMPQDTPVVESTLRSKVNFPGFTYQAPESVLNDSVLNQK